MTYRLLTRASARKQSVVRPQMEGRQESDVGVDQSAFWTLFKCNIGSVLIGICGKHCVGLVAGDGVSIALTILLRSIESRDIGLIESESLLLEHGAKLRQRLLDRRSSQWVRRVNLDPRQLVVGLDRSSIGPRLSG